MGFKSILEKMISRPFGKEIQIELDVRSKNFRLSVPVIQSKTSLETCIKNYVEARENHTFKPYKTSFVMKENGVFLVQEIPFQWGFQPGIRGQILQFIELGKQSREMLMEMAFEEAAATRPRFESGP